jgi:hypothetical protein
MAHRAGQPVQLRGDEHITFAEIVDGRPELVALGDAADLLGEDLGTACGLGDMSAAANLSWAHAM